MNNWKDYLFEKFTDSDFVVEHLDDKYDIIERYSIKRKNSSITTEIVFEIFKSDNYKDLFNVLFYNPDSPIWNESNNEDMYGFDGQGSTFNNENVIHLNDWLLIPLKHGWTEKTTYYADKPIKTDLIWIKNGKLIEIPIKQNYLEKFGCLTLPLIPFVIWWTNWKLKQKPTKVRIDERVIAPMF